MALRSLHTLYFVVLVLFAGSVLAEGNSGGSAKSDIALEKLKRSSQKKSGKNIFAAKSWGGTTRRPSQSKGAAVAAPKVATPVAPPLPFSYMGRMVDEESGKLVLYLSKGDVPYTVSVGDQIDGTYRVEAVTETELTLIYLPLNIKQILTIGDRNS